MNQIKKFFRKGYPDTLFWLSFVLLNCLLFVPITAFYWNQTSFWPTRETADFDLTEIIQSLLLHRENLDIFRLNFEWLLLLLPWIFFKQLRNRYYAYAVAGFYLLQLIYATYEGFIRSYYLLDPTLFNDFLLFNDLTGFVLNNLQISWGLYGLGTVLLIVFLGFLLWLVWSFILRLPTERLSSATRLGVVVLALITFGVLANVGEAVGEPQTAVNSLTYKLWQNNGRSQHAAARANRFSSERLAATYQFTTSSLEKRPNIYLIFIESYGSVLYKRRDFNTQYEILQRKLEKKLQDNQWFIASNRSEAPTWGGASWVSYTSALVGARLETHAEFLALLSQYDDKPYPHLINYLNSQGYYNVRLSSISRELDDEQWSAYKKFYGFDDWLRFSDMDYEGPLYGWGPATPDQYTLHFAHDYINQATDDPYLFFFISQNSHYPWFPLPEVATDWRSIADLPDAPPAPVQRVRHEELRQRYMDSIAYELNAYVDFILTEGDEDDIFVLIGDHQPARVASRRDGWDTPLHIISKDNAFIESFHTLDFQQGLMTRGVEPALHHEGFYSLFARLLLQHYGADNALLPEYEPAGFQLNAPKEG